VAVLDADGDGDVDIAVTHVSSNDIALLINDGAGQFSALPRFDGGVVGEWALGAGDMDNDGILDLVVAGRTSNTALQRVAVLQGDGMAGFTPISTQNSDGLTWMLNVADLNGDGHEDVAVVNSTSNSGAILLGDGAGNLGPPDRVLTDPFAIATDVGDMDGDGDLDWVTSSYGGDWLLFTNDGTGSFTFDQRFASPQAASCALMFDADNDQDLDLALIDEIQDVALVLENLGGIEIPAASTWSILALALVLLSAATVLLSANLSRASSR